MNDNDEEPDIVLDNEPSEGRVEEESNYDNEEELLRELETYLW